MCRWRKPPRMLCAVFQKRAHSVSIERNSIPAPALLRCLKHPQEFPGACRVFALVVIKIEPVEYFFPIPNPQPPPSFIYVSVVAVATGYVAARNKETRQDTVIVPSSQNILIFIEERAFTFYHSKKNNHESVETTCFLQTRTALFCTSIRAATSDFFCWLTGWIFFYQLIDQSRRLLCFHHPLNMKYVESQSQTNASVVVSTQYVATIFTAGNSIQVSSSKIVKERRQLAKYSMAVMFGPAH